MLMFYLKFYLRQQKLERESTVRETTIFQTEIDGGP